MFTGEPPGRRRINLSGKTQVTVDKQALLEQSRREREERELVRKRAEAGIRIARTARGHLVRQHVKSRILNQATQAEDEKLLTLIHVASCIHVRPDIPLSDLERAIEVLMRSGDYSSSVVAFLRASAVIREVFRSHDESTIRQLVPVIGALVSNCRSFRFVPRRTNELTAFFRVMDINTVCLLMRNLMMTQSEYTLLERASLVFFQELREIDSDRVLDIGLSLPSLRSDLILSSLDPLRISENMVSLLLIALTKERQDVHRLIRSVQSVMEQVPVESQETLASAILSKLISQPNVKGQFVLLEIVRLESLSEELLYKLATQTQLVEETAIELISLFRTRPADPRIPVLVSKFTLLYSKVVAGISAGYTSVLSTESLEDLFPLLNRFAYESITSFSPIDESVFHLVRAVFDKKHIYPRLRDESVWTIADSVFHIPNTVYAYDLTLHESEDMLDEPLMPEPSSHKTVFDNLIEYLPHVIPFQRRLRIFAAALAEDQLRHTRQAWTSRMPWEMAGRVKKVRRQFLIEDGLDVISSATRDVLRIEFVGADGTVEAGIDGGGLFKEFMQQWTIGLMNPEFGLFAQLPSGRLVPSLDAYRTHSGADKLFRAAGRAVGKALYEMVLLETHLSEAFLSRVLGKPFSLDQLREIDEGLYRNLRFVNECESVEELGLTFAVSSGTGDSHDLIPNGSEIPVTNSNKLRYVLLASWYYLARQLDRPAAAFAAGLEELLPLSRLRIFSPSEINLLVSGEQRKGFDVEELKKNVVFGGGYSEHSTTVKQLWEVLSEEFSDEDRSAFLAFVTSAPRPPLLGFRVMHPKFGINRVPDRDRLPTSSTCANLLKLPDYQDAWTLKQKLLAAIYSQSGFDLS